jgi:dihydrofolate reductase
MPPETYDGSLTSDGKYLKPMMILACDLDGVLGHKNTMVWPRIPEDMDWFRYHTCGRIVIMGKNTFQSLGNKPLKNRINIVAFNFETNPDLVIEIKQTMDMIANKSHDIYHKWGKVSGNRNSDKMIVFSTHSDNETVLVYMDTSDNGIKINEIGKIYDLLQLTLQCLLVDNERFKCVENYTIVYIGGASIYEYILQEENKVELGKIHLSIINRYCQVDEETVKKIDKDLLMKYIRKNEMFPKYNEIPRYLSLDPFKADGTKRLKTDQCISIGRLFEDDRCDSTISFYTFTTHTNSPI